jgi:Carboxypeptidase regulatory-like domain
MTINRMQLLFVHYRRGCMLLSLLIFFATPPLLAQSTSRRAGAITGKVVTENGQPIPNARVSLFAAGSFKENNGTTTDRDGRFEFRGLEPLNYYVSAVHKAYVPLLLNLDDSEPSTYRVGDSVTVVLTKGAVITGTVTNQAGEPVVGVRVRARIIRGDGSLLPFLSGRYIPERSTDDRGIYRIYGLPAGTYVVWAGGAGSGMNPGMDPFDADVPTYSPNSNRDTAAEIIVRAGEEASGVDIRYRGEQGRVISGIARGPKGIQVVGFGISLTSAMPGGIQTMTKQGPDERGFAFYAVDDGEYYVTAMSQQQQSGEDWAISPPKRVTVRGADVTGIELVTEPLASVNGRIVLVDSKAAECSGKQRPLFTETSVSAVQKESYAASYATQLRWPWGLFTSVDAQGNVSLKNLVPGRYSFVTQFHAKSWYLQSAVLAPAAATTAKTSTGLKPVDAARVWTTLEPGDRLSGLTITLAEGAASLRGQLTVGEGETRPERSIVYLVPAERENAGDVLRFFAAAVAADGKFALNNLAPGRYWMLTKSLSDNDVSPLTKLRSPDETETRAKLRREAEAAKTEIEFKPCQNVVGYQVKPAPQ